MIDEIESYMAGVLENRMREYGLKESGKTNDELRRRYLLVGAGAALELSRSSGTIEEFQERLLGYLREKKDRNEY